MSLRAKFLTGCLARIGNKSSHLWCAIPCQIHTPHSNFILTPAFQGRHYCSTHFTDEAKEAESALVNILSSQMNTQGYQNSNQAWSE